MLKRFISIGLIFSLLALVSCSNSNSASEANLSSDNSSVYISDSDRQSKTNNSSQDGITITVKATDYTDGYLNFEYNGESYSLALDRNQFTDDDYAEGMKLISEQVINNKLGEEITAELVVSDDISQIYSCDVVNQNGMIFRSGMLDSEEEDLKRKAENPDIEKEYLYTLKKIDGTKYELSNINRTLEIDLNDLPVCEKVVYPDETVDVSFSGYLFTDGKFIINQLLPISVVNESDGSAEYIEMTTADYTMFFGTVEGVDEDTAKILLTDNVTEITVPTYYCEEELIADLQVAVTLDCDSTLFSSGKSQTFDYAVIQAKTENFNPDGIAFETLAYAVSSSFELGKYDYKFIE